MEKQKKSDNPLFVSVKLREEWIDHHEEWSKCQRCNLHQGARSYVLARGQIPCNVLMIGEAPGKSEDLLGIPFIGPAGKILDAIIEQVEKKHPFTYCIANTVACIPTTILDSSGYVSKPMVEEQEACLPRLKKLLDMSRPKMVISLGQIAACSLFLSYCKNEKHVLTEHINHPSYVLRMGGVKSLSFKTIVHRLTNIIHHLPDR